MWAALNRRELGWVVQDRPLRAFNAITDIGTVGTPDTEVFTYADAWIDVNTIAYCINNSSNPSLDINRLELLTIDKALLALLKRPGVEKLRCTLILGPSSSG